MHRDSWVGAGGTYDRSHPLHPKASVSAMVPPPSPFPPPFVKKTKENEMGQSHHCTYVRICWVGFLGSSLIDFGHEMQDARCKMRDARYGDGDAEMRRYNQGLAVCGHPSSKLQMLYIHTVCISIAFCYYVCLIFPFFISFFPDLESEFDGGTYFDCMYVGLRSFLSLFLSFFLSSVLFCSPSRLNFVETNCVSLTCVET